MDKKEIEKKKSDTAIKTEAKYKLSPCVIAIVVLAILLLASIFTNGFYGLANGWALITKDRVAKNTIDYINSNGLLPSGYTASGGRIKIAGNGLYQLDVDIISDSSSTPQTVRTYVTMNGKIFITGFVDMSQKSTDTDYGY